MNRLLVVVRNDMPLAYQGVQGGHALAQWLLETPGQTWNNNTLIYLQTADLDKLRYKLDLYEIPYTRFHEPDMNNAVTAIACQSEHKMFDNMKLMGA